MYKLLFLDFFIVTFWQGVRDDFRDDFQDDFQDDFFSQLNWAPIRDIFSNPNI